MLRGGEIVNEHTLLNFYNFHTALLPLLFIVFMVLHFWLIRKAKGVTVAHSTELKMVDVKPELISKEIFIGLILIASIMLFSMFFDAPLLEKANPMISPNPSKAPWYFMGIQELLINLHPIIATLIIPLFLGLFFYLIAKINIKKDKVGQWYYSTKGKKIISFSVMFSAIITTVIIVMLEYGLQLNQLKISLFISTGIIPLLLYILPVSVFIFYLKRSLKADRIELIIAITTIILTSYIVMSIIGVWLRGEGMHLIF